jgi:D-serine deaminase-like pyridoxal phosphate-dependent protein
MVMALHLSDIPTPAALIDETRMMGNIVSMQERMAALGVRLRPHVKTTKCVEVARRQQAAGASGITVSTLKEAEQFFAAGFADVLYAVCIPPGSSTARWRCADRDARSPFSWTHCRRRRRSSPKARRNGTPST